jgi:ParB-like chromosome segregation protein Spo0J
MEFHPLAKKFPLMAEAPLQLIVDDLKANGFDPHFPIVTYEGMILAGRNRFRACKIAKVKPVIVELPKGIDPVAFVERENALRNHYTQAVLDALLEERKQRILNGHANGKSTRTIAKEEGISQTRVMQELATSEVETEQGAVQKGQTKSKLIPELSQANLSPRIIPELEALPKKTQGAVALKIAEGMNPRQAIDHVKTVQATKAMDKEIADARDELGFPLPTKALKDIFGDTFIKDCIRQIDNMITGCKSASRWAKYLLFAEVNEALESMRRKFENALPHAVHQECKGKGCDQCRGSGYFPEWRHKEYEHQKRMEAKK